MPKVSVIVPVYNAEKYIEHCVRSLFNQTLDDIEYIFIDDCTPDNSMEVLQRVMDEYPQRKLNTKIITHTTNTGQSGSRKDGLLVATGDYIIHCDADDWVDVDMYENMYRKAIEDNVEAVCCDIKLEHDGSYKYTVLQYDNKHDDHQLMWGCVAPFSVEYFSLCNRLVMREVYERHSLQPFDGVNMWDDIGLSIRIRYYVNSTSVINQAYYHYNMLNYVSTTKRPMLDKLKEKIMCVNYIEAFFKEKHDGEIYRNFISYLKVHAKEDLFRYDADLWINTFKETRKDLWKLRKKYKKNRMFKYLMLSYGGFFGKLLWKICWKR